VEEFVASAESGCPATRARTARSARLGTETRPAWKTSELLGFLLLAAGGPAKSGSRSPDDDPRDAD
jgi:hypothetical protein